VAGLHQPSRYTRAEPKRKWSLHRYANVLWMDVSTGA